MTPSDSASVGRTRVWPDYGHAYRLSLLRGRLIGTQTLEFSGVTSRDPSGSSRSGNEPGTVASPATLRDSCVHPLSYFVVSFAPRSLGAEHVPVAWWLLRLVVACNDSCGPDLDSLHFDRKKRPPSYVLGERRAGVRLGAALNEPVFARPGVVRIRRRAPGPDDTHSPT